ncbi:hypothetical protein [Streptomyces sp. NPDC047000]|uniref:hypothetical protein n=1 Tax=Streptomyces sp. NPDC047000 TaxID=3155474 RepID=UPI0033DCE749
MTRWTTAAVVTTASAVLVLAPVLTGCSDNNSPSSTASKAASAASSLASQGASAASSLASQAASAGSSLSSQAASALASATAEAGQKLDEIKNGTNVKSDVTLGTPATGSDGRTTVQVTVRNTAGSTKSFAVEVTFRDSGGGLLDVVIVTLSDVPAGKSADATARSTHQLSGDGGVKAEVGQAVRY